MEPSGPWNLDRVDEFLEDTTVPVRIGCHTPSGTPWIVSLWFTWDGAINCATSADADLVDFLAHDDHVSFEVSTNDPPYKGVRGRGHTTVSVDEEKTLLRSLLERYLGGVDNEVGDRLLSPDREEVRVRIDPKRLHTWDYSQRMPGTED